MAQRTCSQIFTTSVISTQAQSIGLLQNVLGLQWADYKLKELLDEYQVWTLMNTNRSRQSFINHITQIKPIPAIRDTKGVLRIVDSNHTFYALSHFMASENPNFSVHLKLVKDYTTRAPGRETAWTDQEMLSDLINNNLITLHGQPRPTLDDIRNLPSSILDLPDLPERSVLGFVFRAFETTLKGSDFTPMIQFRLAEKMRQLGIEPISENPYSPENINRLTQAIIDSPELRQFLIENLNPRATTDRRELIRNYLINLSA